MDSHAVVNSSSQQISRYRLIRPFLTLKTLWVLVFWSFGLFAVFLSPAPITVTSEMHERFEKKLSIANELETKALSASDHAYSLRAYTNSAKVWFWRFRPEHREVVRERQKIEQEAWEEAKNTRKEHLNAVSSAKSELGVWTDSGVNESRNLFWRAYQSGKVFAQRQTITDALFSLLTHQNSDTLSRFLFLLIITCVNFTTGMLSAFFLFLIQLPGLIMSFQAGWLSGTLFFFVSALGGLSVIAAFLTLLYLSMVVFTVSLASPMLQRLENRRGDEYYYINHQRPHQD